MTGEKLIRHRTWTKPSQDLGKLLLQNKQDDDRYVVRIEERHNHVVGKRTIARVRETSINPNCVFYRVVQPSSTTFDGFVGKNAYIRPNPSDFCRRCAEASVREAYLN